LGVENKWRQQRSFFIICLVIGAITAWICKEESPSMIPVSRAIASDSGMEERIIYPHNAQDLPTLFRNIKSQTNYDFAFLVRPETATPTLKPEYLPKEVTLRTFCDQVAKLLSCGWREKDRLILFEPNHSPGLISKESVSVARDIVTLQTEGLKFASSFDEQQRKVMAAHQGYLRYKDLTDEQQSMLSHFDSKSGVVSSFKDLYGDTFDAGKLRIGVFVTDSIRIRKGDDKWGGWMGYFDHSYKGPLWENKRGSE